jgi:hypothetical protein
MWYRYHLFKIGITHLSSLYSVAAVQPAPLACYSLGDRFPRFVEPEGAHHSLGNNFGQVEIKTCKQMDSWKRKESSGIFVVREGQTDTERAIKSVDN